MTLTQWLEFFKKHQDISIFHINHFKLLTAMSDHSLRVALCRLTGTGTVKRICRGFYANPFHSPTIEEIAARIYQPSYISLESALSVYGVLSQIPRVLTCVTTRLPRIFKTGFGVIEYRQVKPAYFTGFMEKNNFFIACREKAVADYLYLQSAKNRERVLAGLDMAEVDGQKLTMYFRKMSIG